MTQAPPTAQKAADTARKIRLILWILIGVVVMAGIVGYAVLMASKTAPTAAAPAAEAQLVREDSHRITIPAVEKAQLVEFLDFECESGALLCRSWRT